jgi:hypothetical protein
MWVGVISEAVVVCFAMLASIPYISIIPQGGRNCTSVVVYYVFVDDGWGGWTRTTNLPGNNRVSLPVGPHPSDLLTPWFY